MHATALLGPSGIVNPTEVVAPDVIRDMDETIRLTTTFLENAPTGNYSIMVVGQGTTEDEVFECVKIISEVATYHKLIIGLPKHITADDPLARMRIAYRLRHTGHPDPIHLLGFGSQPWVELEEAKRLSFIRSVDTSMPFALAQVNEKLTKETARDPLGLVTDFSSSLDNQLVEDNVLTALRWVVRKHPLARCEQCTLRPQDFVPSSWPKDTSRVWAFVGEAPGAEEVKEGMPFSPRGYGQQLNAGRILWHCLHQVETTRENTFVANVCSCRPPGNRKPEPREIEACIDKLVSELVQVKPKQVTLLGAVPVQALLRSRAPIKDARLRDYTLPELPGVPVFVTYHPAALLRTGSYADDFALDIERQYDRLTGTVTDNTVQMQATVIESDEALEQVCQEIEAVGEVAVDTETSGLEPLTDIFLCIQFCWGDKVAVVDGEYLHRAPQALYRINEMLGRVRQIYHNAKFDVEFLREYGVLNARCDEDTMMLSYSLDERQGVHSLKHHAKLHCGAPDYDAVLAKYLPRKDASFEEVPKEVLFRYAALDAYYTRRVYDVLWNEMDETLRRLYRNILIPASEALIPVELNGMLYDPVYAQELAGTLRQKLDSIQQQMDAITKTPLNANSPKQVLEYLVSRGLPLRDSVDKDHLEPFLDSHPVVRLVLDYRDVSKSLSTYVEGWAKVRWEDGRVHSSFLLHGTPTGRLSSRKPNQQNMERDPVIRNIIVAPPGWVLVQFDAKQHELRIMGYLSKDRWLTQVFKDGRDVHGEVSTELFGPDWTKEDRVVAKMVVFGLGYGQEDYGLARHLGIPVAQAAAYRRRFLDQIPDYLAWVADIHKFVLGGGVLETQFGRRRRFGLITDNVVHHVLKQAQNFPVQSTAHDLILLSLIEVVLGGHVDLDVCRPINEIHDALLFEVPEDALEVQIPLLKQVIESKLNSVLDPPAEFPFLVEVSVGKRWGELGGYEGH